MSTVDDDRIKPKYTKKAVPKKAPANKSVLQEKAKQVGTPTKARAVFKKGCPKYGRPRWAIEN